MALANPNNGEPLQIIYWESETHNGDVTHELKVNEDNLEKVFLHPDVGNKPVVIVSIAGAFRKGKSFFLGIIMKYLETEDGDWLTTNDRIEGFEWRGGCDLVTSGIYIWSKPFIRKNRFGEEVALLLMDTQGTFDNESSNEDCSKIFALSCLISSVQIYNIMQEIQEIDLQHLEFFTEYGRMVAELSDTRWENISLLIFLIRDWRCPQSYPFGRNGGKDYIRNVLEIKAGHQGEHKNIRKKVKNVNKEACLLPYPGNRVSTHQDFHGEVNNIDEDFIKIVKEFVPHIMSKDMLKEKRVNNRKVTGNFCFQYVADLVQCFETKRLPTPKTLLEATARYWRQCVIKDLTDRYTKKMEKSMDDHNGEIQKEDFENWHNENKGQIIKEFAATKQMNIEEDDSDALIDELYCQIKTSYRLLWLTAEQRNEILKKQKQDFLNYLASCFRCLAVMRVLLSCIVSCFECSSDGEYDD